MLEDLRDYLFKVEELPRAEVRVDTARQCPQDGWPVVPHFHEQFEMVIYYDINCTCMINGDETALRGGQAVFFPPYTMHSFDVEAGPSDFTVMQFSRQFADELFGPDWSFDEPFVCTYTPELFEQICSLIKVYDSMPADGAVAESLMRTIVMWMWEPREDITLYVGGKTRFQKLLRYISENELFALNAEEAASICGVSRPYFMNSFKKQFEITYNDFLIQRKVAYAEDMLLNSDRKSAEIAADLGFDDPSYFVKVFKKVTGITPKKYRSGK